MQIVYEAVDSADAQRVRRLLAQQGIHSSSFGAALEGDTGLAQADGAVRIEVADDDLARARLIVEEWQATAMPSNEGEQEQVELRSSGDLHAHGTSSAPDAPAPTSERKPFDSGYGVPSLIFATIVGAVVGIFVFEQWSHKAPPRTQMVDTDTDGDGQPDQWTTYIDGQPARMRSDRNGDGKIDQVARFKNGMIQSAEQDNDFDGRNETQSRYVRNEVATYSIDRDGDGKPDFRASGPYGLMLTVEWLDSKGRVIKQVRNTATLTVDDKFDSDGDGVLDVERTYDERGEITATRPLQRR